MKICTLCGKSYNPVKDLKRRKYCSIECSKAAQKRVKPNAATNPVMFCDQCGALIRTTDRSSRICAMCDLGDGIYGDANKGWEPLSVGGRVYKTPKMR